MLSNNPVYTFPPFCSDSLSRQPGDVVIQSYIGPSGSSMATSGMVSGPIRSAGEVTPKTPLSVESPDGARNKKKKVSSRLVCHQASHLEVI